MLNKLLQWKKMFNPNTSIGQIAHRHISIETLDHNLMLPSNLKAGTQNGAISPPIS